MQKDLGHRCGGHQGHVKEEAQRGMETIADPETCVYAGWTGWTATRSSGATPGSRPTSGRTSSSPPRTPTGHRISSTTRTRASCRRPAGTGRRWGCTPTPPSASPWAPPPCASASPRSSSTRAPGWRTTTTATSRRGWEDGWEGMRLRRRGE